MSFPTNLPSYTITSTSESPNTTAGGVGLSSLLNSFEVDITAIGTKIGTGSSTPALNKVLAGTGTGTSAWSTSLAGLTLTTATITSPTITTPTVTDLTNMQHSHANAAGGGQIGNSGISGVGTEKLANPYKFFVYRNAALNTTVGMSAITYDTRIYDTGSNVDITTNKGRFTAPAAGFYQFQGATLISATNGDHFLGSLMKNGVEVYRGYEYTVSATVNHTFNFTSPLIQLAINDYIEFGISANAARGILVANAGAYCWFSGYLVSTT